MADGLLRLGIIPARARSSRFPNKITAKINKKPMIQYVWEAAQRSRLLSEVLVATDDNSIANVVEEFGGKVVLTPSTFESGTDRVAFVTKHHPADIVVNLQGDEPLIDSEAIDKLIRGLESDPKAEMATLAVRKSALSQLKSSHVVKVLVSDSGQALYFSRHPLSSDMEGNFLKHIGIYAFRHEALMRFCDLPHSDLEKVERLEQLRALEAGFRIKVIEVEKDTIAVDTPSDLVKVEQFLLSQETMI